MNSKGFIENYNLKEKNGDTFTAELFISKDMPFFDGHFENFKILPAIAQIKIAIDIIKKEFNADFYVRKLSKVKFINKIFPDTNINIWVHSSKDFIDFKIYDDEKKYSEGRAYLSDYETLD